MMDAHDNNTRGGVRRRPPTAPYSAAAASYGTSSEEDTLLPSHNEEGYPVLQSYIDRRRSSMGGSPWYRQPQKFILAAALAWVGSVMYLASLAHAILRTHMEASHVNMMGMSSGSIIDGDSDFKQWLVEQGMLKNAYGASNSGKASDEHVRQWLESRANNKYGASGETNEDFQKWLQSQNKYGASGETNEDFQKWLQSQNKYGSASNGDAWSDLMKDLTANGGKFGSSNTNSGNKNDVNVRFGNGDAKKNKYGSASTGDAWSDLMRDLEANGGKFGSSNANSGNKNDVNVRFGSGDANYQEWLEYQQKNHQVKYGANGMYDKSEKSANNLAAASQSSSATSSLTSDQQQAAIAISDSSLSTIDWPLQGLPHVSCTASSGCSPSSNVTVLIVYGPEYHTHISEMAWNVATGVHAAFQSHIRHHPNSPLHGHIVYGHTSNITFLDVIDADAVIIGSPVYNGNVHPDVQNWINYWHIDADLSNKFGGAFATAGGLHAGADGTIMSIVRSMMVFQMMAVGGDSWTSPFGAVATMYEDPFGDTRRTGYFDSSCYFTEKDGRGGDHLVHPYFLSKAYGLGERIANVTVAWKNSSYVRWD